MSDSVPAIEVKGLAHRYGNHIALQGLNFSMQAGEIFGLLGPNGGGKTTLFRILATLLPVQEGIAHVVGLDVRNEPSLVRAAIGVTFQSPSVDGKLTVTENLRHQGHLYGLSGQVLKMRIREQLNRLGLNERAVDRVDSLSGGLKRRVEVAKGLLHQPRVLLLDEPSTGLDPGARHDLWQHLQHLKHEAGMTVLVTTHLMEEAERCDRLGILDKGQLVALGTPDELRSSVGRTCVTIRTAHPEEFATRLAGELNVQPQRVGAELRMEPASGHEFVHLLMERFPNEVDSVSLGKPTLEDVFIARTGHRFWEREADDDAENRGGE